MWKWLQIKRNRVMAMAPFVLLLLVSHALMFALEKYQLVWMVSYTIAALGIGVLGGLMSIAENKDQNNSLTSGVTDNSKSSCG